MNRPEKISANTSALSAVRNRIAPRAARQLLIAALSLAAFASICIVLGNRGSNAPSPLAGASSPSPRLTTAQARAAYGQLPLSFEANHGQIDGSANFVARGAGYTLTLSPSGAAFALAAHPDAGSHGNESSLDRGDPSSTKGAAKREDETSKPRAKPQSKMLRMNLVGANQKTSMAGLDQLEGRVNYFIGKDPAKWRTNIPTFARARYYEVYPGIDVVYYGNQMRLEYDFVIAPGRDPRTVRLQFDGADKVEVDSHGDLLLSLGESVMRQPKPIVYQEVAGERIGIAGNYNVDSQGHVGFALGEYDVRLPLVIDPVLVYSTYLGGSGADEGNDIAVDSAGNAYICGNTNSTNFPVANAFQATFGGATFVGGRDGFVSKFNAAGNALVYSTYLGGGGDDRCAKIAVDSAGNSYVGGETTSTDFPVANAVQATFGGGLSDAFVTKLNAAGSALVYSTFIGGSIFDAGNAIALDSSNNVYLSGRTTSENFPTVNPIQATYTGGPFADSYVTKINAAGTAFVYSTYFGGTDFDAGSSIAVDSSGNAYLTGQTRSTNLPMVNAIQATFGGGDLEGDAFVTKFNAAGSALVYSTYLGGSLNDIGFEIAVDSAGGAYVVGSTDSNNFPVANAFQNALSGTSDGFVTKLNAAGSAFAYSTYLGGTSDDSVNGVAVNSAGTAYIAGGTTSSNFPTVNPTQGTSGGGTDGFVGQLNTAGSALLYSTYLGGSDSDAALAIKLDATGSMYVAGRTTSTNFPLLNPVQATHGGGGNNDAFVTKISETASPTPTPTPSPSPSPSPSPTPTPTTVQFTDAVHSSQEDCTSIGITVTRSGSLTGTTTVDYATSDLTAAQRMDYGIALGRLTFAPNETSKVIPILINEDSYVEGLETATISLSNPTGGTLGVVSTATIQIIDDAAEPSTNVIDEPGIFVCQQYHDFLNRDPDPAGFQGWVNLLNSCPSGSTACDRIEVSASFFRSEEFQQRGFFVYLFYSTALGRKPQYLEFMRDLSLTTGFLSDAQLEAGKVAFIDEFMMRQEFRTKYDALTTPTDYVNALEQTAGVVLSNKQQLIDGLTQGTLTRAQVLRAIAGSNEVKIKYFREAFVVEAYFGYLRREPDALFNTWIQIFNQTNDYRNIINGFMNSREYRLRFAP